jgi:hypothetical protein
MILKTRGTFFETLVASVYTTALVTATVVNSAFYEYG